MIKFGIQTQKSDWRTEVPPIINSRKQEDKWLQSFITTYRNTEKNISEKKIPSDLKCAEVNESVFFSKCIQLSTLKEGQESFAQFLISDGGVIYVTVQW